MTDIKVSVKVEANGKTKTYQLHQTAKATLSERTGKTTLAHFQPADGNVVLKGFSKLYLDTEELAKAKGNGS